MSELTVDTPTDEAESDVETKEVGFYNIFDGERGRTDSTYLDMQERVQAEKQRAIVEGREPELDDLGALPPGAGTPMVTKGQLVDNAVMSNPSVLHTDPEQESDPVLTADVAVEQEAGVTDTSYVDMAATEPGPTPGVTDGGTPELTEEELASQGY